MKQAFELGHISFKDIFITIINEVKQNMLPMHECISREIETTKMNQMEILELKKHNIQNKSSVDALR